ncbi:MAG: hypothetical protein AAGA21_21990 [Pseudomonadota bacterium]
MIQDGRQDMRRGAEPGHAAGGAPSEVVVGSLADTAQLIEPDLAFREPADAALADVLHPLSRRWKDVVINFNARQGLEDLDGLGWQRHFVLTLRLRQFGGDTPKALLKIDVLPSRLGDLAPTLGQQDQKLRERPERPAERLGCPKDSQELVIVENAIARPLLGWTGNSGSWIGLDAVTFERPSE